MTWQDSIINAVGPLAATFDIKADDWPLGSISKILHKYDEDLRQRLQSFSALYHFVPQDRSFVSTDSKKATEEIRVTT